MLLIGPHSHPGTSNGSEIRQNTDSAMHGLLNKGLLSGFSFGFATGTSLDTRNKELHVFVGTIKV